jgi:hypothetical protein
MNRKILIPLNVSFCEIAQFYDWNHGNSDYLQDNPILDLVSRFEAKENGYQTACLKTKAYLLQSLKQSEGKLCYEMITQGHRCITTEVDGLPSDMQPGELTLETMLFFQDTNGGMILSQDMKKIYSKDPLMRYITRSDRVYKLGRIKVTHPELIQTRIEQTIEKFNNDILKSKKQIDKARIIYNTCQQLEILHPFADGNFAYLL